MKQLPLPGGLTRRAVLAFAVLAPFVSPMSKPVAKPTRRIDLPAPDRTGRRSVESALGARRSVREFRKAPLSLAEVAQLLWAAQGVTDPEGFRTAPSSGALYPLATTLVVGNVTDLPVGMYRYAPATHTLTRVGGDDLRERLADAALDQAWIADAAGILAFAAVYRRTTAKYGERGIRYVHMETGHVAENVYLQAAALGLGTTIVGAFHDARVKEILALSDEEEPLALLPVGKR